MPTITFSLTDLNSLVGKKLSIEDVSKLAQCGKAEVDGYDEDSDELKMNFDDTNLA